MNSHKPYLIFIAYAVFVAIGIASGLLNIAWTYMQPTFDVSLDSLGTLLTAGTIGGLIAAFMSGYIIGKFTIGKVILAGLLIAGVGLIGYGIAPMWVILLFIAFITSIGKGTIDAGLNNFVSANYGASEMNWLHACWGIGLTIAPMIVTYITINLNQSWQVAYWIMGGLVLGLGVLVLLSLPQWRLNVPQKDDSSHTDHAVTPQETVRQPIVILSVLFFFVYGGLEIGTGQLAFTLFVNSREIPPAIASNWVSAYWGSFTVGRMLMGLLALRIGDKPLLYASLSMGVVGSFLLFLNLSDVVSLTGLLLLGFGQAAIFPILISQTPHRVGIRHAANTIGFQVGFAGMGGAALAGIAGVVAENFGIETISAFLFVTAIVLFSLYQLIIWWENQPPVITKIKRG